MLLLMQVGPKPEAGKAIAATPAIANSATLVQPAGQTLADGSTAELKADAEIRVEYGQEYRRVTLVRGEAHFTAAKDATRPIVARAGDVDVCAVGTAFAVQFATSKVDVIVTDGTVRVGRGAGSTMRAAAPTSTAAELGVVVKRPS